MKNFYFKERKIKMRVYFALMTSAVIIIITSLFALYVSFNVKNLAGRYETDISKLKYSITSMLLQTVSVDVKKNNFEATGAMVDLLKREELLSYVYVKDKKSRKVIAGSKIGDFSALTRDNQTIKEVSKDIGNTTVYVGIPLDDKLRVYSANFRNFIIDIFLAFIILGLISSFMMTGIISKTLEKLSNAARQIADGNFDVKIEESNFSEINELVYTYNEMALQLNELYSSLEQKVQERTVALEEANYKLKETQAMMVHSEKMRSLGELVAGIAHEINNPVNFIHGNIMILQNYADDMLKLIDLYEENNVNFPDDIRAKIEALRKQIDLDFLRSDIKDLIRSCIEGTQRTKNIVLDLKNFSRMEEMVLTQFDIPKEIDTTLNILNNKYKNRITVVKNYNPDVPKIEAFGGQLNQVFMNILDNAQDAIDGQGTVTINVSKIEDKVKIEFIDTGSGISEENIKKVFDPFFTTKAVGKGTGLGMSISYRVIKDHQGTIDIESTVGKGSKFTIILPINHEMKKEEENKD